MIRLIRFIILIVFIALLVDGSGANEEINRTQIWAKDLYRIKYSFFVHFVSLVQSNPLQSTPPHSDLMESSLAMENLPCIGKTILLSFIFFQLHLFSLTGLKDKTLVYDAISGLVFGLLKVKYTFLFSSHLIFKRISAAITVLRKSNSTQEEGQIMVRATHLFHYFHPRYWPIHLHSTVVYLHFSEHI